MALLLNVLLMFEESHKRTHDILTPWAPQDLNCPSVYHVGYGCMILSISSFYSSDLQATLSAVSMLFL